MSFILTRYDDKDALTEARDRQGWEQPLVQFGRCCLAVANKATCVSVAEFGRKSYALLGSISNHAELRRMLAVFNSGALTASHAELAALLVEHLGFPSLSFIDGAFVLFCDNSATRSLTAVTDVLGQYSLYATAGAGSWISPSPRLAALKPGFRPDFFDIEDVVRDEPRPDDYVPIKNVIRAKPGAALEITIDGQDHACVSSVPFHILRCRGDQNVNLEDGVRALEATLVAAIQSAFSWDGRAFVPLSGGIDSSIVAAYGARFTKLNTVAFGTERSNEYEPSKQVAVHIGSSHSEIKIDTNEILSGFFDSIYYNSIFDGSAAEVQAGLFALMARLRGKADLIVTGYGADLLLGGIMVPGKRPQIGVNREMWAQVYRTRWSSEFSPVGANMMGMQIRHPYWTPRFLGYCLELAEELKVSNSEVKILLRTFAERQSILPRQTVWRKKLALHHGSSIENILSDTLDIKCTPHAKSMFAYSLYRESVTGKITPETFNPEHALARFKSTV